MSEHSPHYSSPACPKKSRPPDPVPCDENCNTPLPPPCCTIFGAKLSEVQDYRSRLKINLPWVPRTWVEDGLDRRGGGGSGGGGWGGGKGRRGADTCRSREDSNNTHTLIR